MGNWLEDPEVGFVRFSVVPDCVSVMKSGSPFAEESTFDQPTANRLESVMVIGAEIGLVGVWLK